MEIIEKNQKIEITAPQLKIAVFKIIGTSPYVQHKFSEKSKHKMEQTHKEGSVAKKGKKRDPRNFEDDCKGATYFSKEGWIGIPTVQFLSSMVTACKIVGFHMTKAKLALAILPDGYDIGEMKGLVKITGTPQMHIGPARNDNGSIDLRARPLWEKWECELKVRYDADMFSLSDVANLLSRAGMQCGIGEGRPNSRECVGLGWGTFRVA